MTTKAFRQLLPALLCFLAQFSYGQTMVRNIPYEENRQLIKESFQVLKNDTFTKHGFYHKFSPEGVLLEQSNYQKGKLIGKMVNRNPTGDIRTYGYYDMAENFTGFQFSWKDPVQLNQLTITYANASTLGYLDAKKIRAYVEDSLKRKVDKLEALKTSPVFKNLMAEIKPRHQRWMSLSADSPEYNVLGEELIFMYITLLENYTEFAEDEKDILEFQNLSDSLLRMRYPGFYTDQIAILSERCIKYAEPMNRTEVKYCSVKQIVNQIHGYLEKMEMLNILDKQVTRLSSVLAASYRPLSYPVIYEKRLKPMFQEVDDRVAQKNMDQRLARLTILADSMRLYSEKFGEISKINDKIEAKWPELRDKIRRKFPDTWVKSTREISAMNDDYQNEESAEKKITLGNKFLRNLDEFSGIFNEISENSDKIEEYYGKVDSRYAADQRYIYEAQVQPLEKKVNDFRKMENFDDQKINLGRELAKQIELLYRNIDSLNSHEKGIAQNYQTIRQHYEKSYPGIFTKNIKPISQDIDNYQKIADCESKIAKGRTLLATINSYETRFQIIESQKKNMNDSLNLASEQYKKTFPSIYKGDIKLLKTKIKEYELNDTLNLKITKGNDILRNLNRLILYHDSLKRTEATLLAEFPVLKKNFKKRYPKIYKTGIEPVDDQLSSLQDMAKLDNCLLKEKDIYTRVYDFKKKLVELDTMSSKINAGFNQFEATFKNDKANKIILKKGRMVYDVRSDEFLNSDSYDKAMKCGTQLISTLAKLRSYATKENSFLKEQLDKAKTVEAVEASVK